MYVSGARPRIRVALLTALVKDCAAAIVAGRNLRRVWRDGSAGANGLNPHDELKVRGNGIDYHFSLPYLLDIQGKPEAGSLHRRSDSSEGVEPSLTHDFVFSENDQVLCMASCLLLR